MKGNNLLYSKYKEERIKGYKKLFKVQKKTYEPPKHIAKGIVEAMSAQGYDIKLDQAVAYMNASYAVFDRDYYDRGR
tara:strand:+ start:168 stop:398 length:231 start_codon:yes stop_codon:yes gene_type:complete